MKFSEVREVQRDASAGDVRSVSSILFKRILGTIVGFILTVASAHATPPDGPFKLQRVGRIQSFDSSTSRDPRDIYDAEIRSPKSVRFSADGTKVYVNALEAWVTAVYEWPSLKKLKSISHVFTPEDAWRFRGEKTIFDYRYHSRPRRAGEENVFAGKPVESELSHGGRYLWIPYYRRSFDRNGSSPSAVAIVDTSTDEIVRIMPTGPIPKYVTVSPDNRYLAVSHWGDNTVGIIDISSSNPDDFAYVDHLVVERRLPLENLGSVDRDKVCGYCLRGTVFAPDSRTLLVARMGGGGIAVFDVPNGTYRGTVYGMKATPRHLLLSKKGDLFVSSNTSGYVSKIALRTFLDAVERNEGGNTSLSDWREIRVGSGARTMVFSPDEEYVYAAVNVSSELVMLDAEDLRVLARAKVDPFTVGLASSVDGTHLWTTSQGRAGRGGGNSVNIFRVVPSEP
jgi:DNA-binding beta-propeller fold protein YncE